MKGDLCILLVCLRHQPLLQQILCHLDLLGSPRNCDDAIVRTGQRFIYGYIRTRLVPNATNPTAALANYGTSQLQGKRKLLEIKKIIKRYKLIIINKK